MFTTHVTWPYIETWRWRSWLVICGNVQMLRFSPIVLHPSLHLQISLSLLFNHHVFFALSVRPVSQSLSNSLESLSSQFLLIYWHYFQLQPKLDLEWMRQSLKLWLTTLLWLLAYLKTSDACSIDGDWSSYIWIVIWNYWLWWIFENETVTGILVLEHLNCNGTMCCWHRDILPLGTSYHEVLPPLNR